jgi:hypothetical protein
MSEPAKDDIALLRLVGEEIRQTLIKPPYCMEGNGCNVSPCGCSQEAGKAALSAIRAAGWAVVPVEPTMEMLRAGYDESGGRAVIGIWEAMLETAPGAKP